MREKMLISRRLFVGPSWLFSEALSSSQDARIPSPIIDRQLKSYQQVFPGLFWSENDSSESSCVPLAR
jgi:hypothetical protein